MSNIKKDIAKGTYYFIISSGFYEDGRRKQIKRTGFKTKKEAQQKLHEINNELTNQTFVESNSELLGEYIKKWLKRKQT